MSYFYPDRHNIESAYNTGRNLHIFKIKNLTNECGEVDRNRQNSCHLGSVKIRLLCYAQAGIGEVCKIPESPEEAQWNKTGSF
jgi:hypothetical protein